MSPEIEKWRVPWDRGQNWWSRRIRTDDPLLAKQVLYQLSYDPD